jgi:hypothetical protein
MYDALIAAVAGRRIDREYGVRGRAASCGVPRPACRDEVFGGDPWPYGVEPNQATLEALVQYLAEQGLIASPVPVDKLFVPTFGLD